jgi:GpV Apex motif
VNDGNYTRTPVGVSLDRIAHDAVAQALEQVGKGLPCTVVSVSGQFVTVNFEVNGGLYKLPNVTIPINTSQYDWLPVQLGDSGYTQAADVSLAAVSGVSNNVPTLTQSANLTGLCFQPVSNKTWTGPANMRVVQGPGGVLVQDLAATTTFRLTPGNITMSAGGHTIVISSAGVVIDGIVFGTHVHTGVEPGGGDTGPPLA